MTSNAALDAGGRVLHPRCADCPSTRAPFGEGCDLSPEGVKAGRLGRWRCLACWRRWVERLTLVAPAAPAVQGSFL